MRKKYITHVERHKGEILEAMGNGGSFEEVSKRYEVSIPTIYALLRREGFVRSWKKIKDETADGK